MHDRFGDERLEDEGVHAAGVVSAQLELGLADVADRVAPRHQLGRVIVGGQTTPHLAEAVAGDGVGVDAQTLVRVQST